MTIGTDRGVAAGTAVLTVTLTYGGHHGFIGWSRGHRHLHHRRQL